jgi:plasmid maintenance system killer protein
MARSYPAFKSDHHATSLSHSHSGAMLNRSFCHISTRWHPLKDALAGHWAVSENGNWRLTFTFEGTDAILVDYQDYL